MKSLRSRIMHFVRHWHARIGALAAVFFLFLSISGIALNHTDALHLAKTPVQAGWLMRWYGLKPAIPTHGYVFNDGYFAASDERWVLNGHELAAQDFSAYKQNLVGAIAWGDMRAIASEDQLYLYLANGQQVDHISTPTLPETPIEKLGVINSEAMPKLVLKTAKGDFASEDGLAWQMLDKKRSSATNEVVWASEQVLPKSLSSSLVKAFSPSLPLERIVLDLHSGRFFGSYGPLVMDAAALLLMVLSLSGVWIYLRSVRRRSKR